MPIVEGILQARLRELPDRPLTYWTVSEPVSLIGPDGNSFLTFLPDEQRTRKLSLDVAIDFPTVIGKQRLQFDLTQDAFVYGTHARTNCSLTQMRLLKYLGWIFADTRHFGYNRRNILVTATAPPPRCSTRDAPSRPSGTAPASTSSPPSPLSAPDASAVRSSPTAPDTPSTAAS